MWVFHLFLFALCSQCNIWIVVFLHNYTCRNKVSFAVQHFHTKWIDPNKSINCFWSWKCHCRSSVSHHIAKLLICHVIEISIIKCFECISRPVDTCIVIIDYLHVETEHVVEWCWLQCYNHLLCIVFCFFFAREKLVRDIHFGLCIRHLDILCHWPNLLVCRVAVNHIAVHGWWFMSIISIIFRIIFDRRCIFSVSVTYHRWSDCIAQHENKIDGNVALLIIIIICARRSNSSEYFVFTHFNNIPMRNRALVDARTYFGYWHSASALNDGITYVSSVQMGIIKLLLIILCFYQRTMLLMQCEWMSAHFHVDPLHCNHNRMVVYLLCNYVEILRLHISVRKLIKNDTQWTLYSHMWVRREWVVFTFCTLRNIDECLLLVYAHTVDSLIIKILPFYVSIDNSWLALWIYLKRKFPYGSGGGRQNGSGRNS